MLLLMWARNSSAALVWQAQTIAHGLDKAPEVIWFKIRSDGGQGHFGWAVYHVSMPDASTDYVKLNTNEARIQTDTDYMNGTLPTSSVFSMGYNLQKCFLVYLYNYVNMKIYISIYFFKL